MEIPDIAQHYDSQDIIQSAELEKKLSTRYFSRKDVDSVSYTNINYWGKLGVLYDDRAEKSSWRKFSFVELVWLRSIDEMRKMGVPLSTIKKLKEFLFRKFSAKDIYEVLKEQGMSVQETWISDKEKEQVELVFEAIEKGEIDLTAEQELNFFTGLVAGSITTRTPLSILVFKDGSCMPNYEGRVDKDKFHSEDMIQKRTYETHISIPITGIIREFISSDRFLPVLPKLNILNENELKLLQIVQSEEYDSITIKFRGKKIKALEMTKTHDAKKKIVDILDESQYQNITIKSHKGIVTTIENTVKERFD